MNQNDRLVRKLAAAIERFMESGEPELNLRYLSAASEGQTELLEECLRLWDHEGRIEWLKEIDPSNLEVPVVRFRSYITKDVPWRR